MRYLARIMTVAAIMLVIGAGCSRTQRVRIYPGSLPYNSPTTPPPGSTTP